VTLAPWITAPDESATTPAKLPFTDDALVACEKLNIEKLTTVKTSASVKPNLFAITCPFFFRGFCRPGTAEEIGHRPFMSTIRAK